MPPGRKYSFVKAAVAKKEEVTPKTQSVKAAHSYEESSD
jgi:hypothetical protein